MPMQTYTLVVDESETNEAITGDVYNETGTIEESVSLGYDEYGLSPTRDDWEPDQRRSEVTADVTALDLEVQRADDGFEFRLLGDADEELATERVADRDWKLSKVEE